MGPISKLLIYKKSSVKDNPLVQNFLLQILATNFILLGYDIFSGVIAIF